MRLFATAIPIKVIAATAGFDVSYWQIILLIGIVTIIYTYAGGIKAVIWMDVVQMCVYLGGAVWALFILLAKAPVDGWTRLVEAGKSALFYTGFEMDLGLWFTEPYAMITAVLAGALISMASHGVGRQGLVKSRSKVAWVLWFLNADHVETPASAKPLGFS